MRSYQLLGGDYGAPRGSMAARKRRLGGFRYVATPVNAVGGVVGQGDAVQPRAQETKREVERGEHEWRRWVGSSRK